MTVGELKKDLEKFNDSDEVLLETMDCEEDMYRYVHVVKVRKFFTKVVLIGE